MEDSIRSAGEKLLDRLVAKAMEKEGTTPTVLLRGMSGGRMTRITTLSLTMASQGVTVNASQGMIMTFQGELDDEDYELRRQAIFLP